MMEIRLGTESEKQRIISQYPRAKHVMGEGGYLIIAEDRDEIAAFLWAFRRKIPAPVEREELFINVIDVVSEDLRRKGVATKMIETLVAIARKEKVYQIRAYCDIHNVPSHRLWLKNHFAISPVTERDGSVVGSFVSLTLTPGD